MGDGDLCEGALPALDVSVCERFLCGNDDALFLAFRNGDVAPPVHGGDVDRVVHDADADVEEFRRFRQHEIKLVGDGAGAAEFVEAEDGRAVFVFRRGGEHGAAGQIMMAATADVPFDAAREPCIADGEILRLEDGIVRYQIAFCDFVEQLPQTAAELREEDGLEIVVFEHGGIERDVFKLCRVTVLHGIRQRVGITAVVYKQFVFFFEIGDLLARNVAAEGGEDGFGLQRRSLHGEFFKSKHGVGFQVVYGYIRNKNG